MNRPKSQLTLLFTSKDLKWYFTAKLRCLFYVYYFLLTFSLAELTMSKDGCGNVLGPNLTIDIDFILENFPREQREQELKQV